MDTFTRMEQLYRAGDNLPWDRSLPPPEVIALAARLLSGRALDLGCGYGRASIYLAQRRWTCDGVEFIPEAVAEASQRAAAAGVADRVRFHTASVVALDFLDGAYDLALDVGCMHNLRGDNLREYAAGVARLVHVGGFYLLFAHGPDGRGHDQSAEVVRSLFADTFAEERLEHGTTTIIGGATRESTWFWFRRIGDV